MLLFQRKEKLEQERNAALTAVKEQEEAETTFELGLIKKQVEDSIRDAKADTEVSIIWGGEDCCHCKRQTTLLGEN